jgi:type IX secretion system PorP/SprF family membrane protein
MKAKLKYLLLIINLMSGIDLIAQADISMATHWNNRAGYNPAFIARTDYLYLFANTRQQWVGITGAPSVYNIQISEYINSIRSAVGISFITDKVGATQSFNPMFTYAFRIARKQEWAMSMGLSAGMFMRTVNGSMFEAENTIDPTLGYLYEKSIKPDLNVGFEFQNTHFIYGLSATHLFSIAKSENFFLNTNHRYGYAIYRNEEPADFSYSLGVQVVNRYNLTVTEGNVSFRLKRMSNQIKSPLIRGSQEILDFGFTYRSSKQMIFLLGMKISPYLRIGYSYDQSFNSGYYRNGSHEIMLEYRIPAKAASTTFRCGNKEFWYH